MPVTTIDPPFVKPRRRQTRSTWVSRVMLFATVVVLVDALVGEHGFAAGLRARQQYAQGQTQLARMRAENAELRARARRMTSDAATIEWLARTELGWIRPGEVLFIVRPALSRPAENRQPAPVR